MDKKRTSRTIPKMEVEVGKPLFLRVGADSCAGARQKRKHDTTPFHVPSTHTQRGGGGF